MPTTRMSHAPNEHLSAADLKRGQHWTASHAFATGNGYPPSALWRITKVGGDFVQLKRTTTKDTTTVSFGVLLSVWTHQPHLDDG